MNIKKSLFFAGIILIMVVVPILAGADIVEIPNPLDPKYDSPLGIIKAITEILQVLAIAVGVIMIIIAGIQYMTSAGSEDKAKKAKQTIVYALIGVAIVTAVNFIIGLVQEILGKLN